MKETAFICRNSTPKSLILIDELGRATSNEDGVALAWAVSEKLLKSNALTFFVTHYPQVTLMSNVYPTVQNFHLEASVGNGEDGEIFYTHKVGGGPCTVATSYGVDLAYACGWPGDVLGEVSLESWLDWTHAVHQPASSHRQALVRCTLESNQARKFESHLREQSDETQLVSGDSRVSDVTWGETAKSIVHQLTHLVRADGPRDHVSARRELEVGTEEHFAKLCSGAFTTKLRWRLFF